MALFRRPTFLALLLCLPVALNLTRDADAAPFVWTGPTITFTKTGADTADTTDPLNQDRLTDNVWLTRGAVEGMFNIAPGHEDGYVRYTSPDDTLWATSVMPANNGKTISAALWQDQNLSFTTWAAAYGGPGSALGANITTHNAVVHLLTDDIYLDLTFTHFTSGGEYTYVRSTPVPEPSPRSVALQLIVVVVSMFRWRKETRPSGEQSRAICISRQPVQIPRIINLFLRERYDTFRFACRRNPIRACCFSQFTDNCQQPIRFDKRSRARSQRAVSWQLPYGVCLVCDCGYNQGT